ncbi:MAG: lyase family protein [Candidatus Parcubacteria bacterium]|nr:lyase family protein [Candidatus Parcubacteria bacterium]
MCKGENKLEIRNQFDSLSPIDYRYPDKEVAKYLSENGFTHYKLLVELALVRVLYRRGICPETAVKEVEIACSQVTTEEVYEEEDRIRHDIRALVNCIRAKVSENTKPYVHMMATSNDIIDPANAARYKDVVQKVLVPSLVQLEGVIIDITLREADTVQIGRTHGQHAVPITFGFALAGYVSRIGGSIKALKTLAAELPGKFSGAVGAYNASSLFFEDPEMFETEVLAELGLTPAECSTQVIPPEAMTRLLCEIAILSGILANLADDMRNLQRTEIGEVGEEFEAAQVGSSTMPQKRNPINFENAKSCWKIIVPRIVTVLMDQISEHQRDMTNGASIRTHPEIVAYAVHTAKRLTRTMQKLKVDHENLQKNLEMTNGGIIAEPMQLIPSALGHPDAHEKVRLLTLQAQREKRPLEEVIIADSEMQTYLEKMTPYQRQILSNPALYIGIADKKAKTVAERWKKKLEL